MSLTRKALKHLHYPTLSLVNLKELSDEISIIMVSIIFSLTSKILGMMLTWVPVIISPGSSD
ncbi:MAG: hypothetical protein HamCj_20390 [Candidatus Hamiltonella defensa (Ceratovacuna japonica)]|nr:hypothetical protein BJP42_04440 [Candidatus Hamiltonella defensa]